MALLLVAAALVVMEFEGRKHGFEPSVKDGPELWSAYRARANTPPGPSAPLVVIGSSRFQLGVDSRVLSQTVGRPAINLAIDGAWPFNVLSDLATDESFHGIVLCEMGGFIGNVEIADPRGMVKSESYLRYYHARTWIGDAEALLRERVQSQLTFLLPELSARQLFTNALSRRWGLTPSYVRMLPARVRPADYSNASVDIVAHRKHWEEAFRTTAPPATEAQILAFAAHLSEHVHRIQARGGNVIFMRMVSSGGLRLVEERQSPRKDWDLFASRVAGVAFHFEDVPALRSFEASDGSHLDRRLVGDFSRALGAELLRRDSFGSVPMIGASRGAR